MMKRAAVTLSLFTSLGYAQFGKSSKVPGINLVEIDEEQ
jgi:hypothetical protein